MVYFDHSLHTYKIQQCLDAGMQSGDEASPSIRPAGCGQLVKILITLKRHGIL